MTKLEIAKHIADVHNRLAGILASSGMQLLNADSVVLMGDTIKDLRNIAQQIAIDLETDVQKEDKELSKEEE